VGRTPVPLAWFFDEEEDSEPNPFLVRVVASSAPSKKKLSSVSGR
jgi:hypothetical protein